MSSSKSRSKGKARKKISPAPPSEVKIPVAVPVTSAPAPIALAKPVAPATHVEEAVAPKQSVPSPEPAVERPSDRFWMAAMGVMVLAIVLRQVQLGQAPFHPDETIHAYFSYGFGTYHYDPVYHGPLLYHLTSLVFQLFGQYDYVARVVPSLLGIGLVALILGPTRQWMGNRAALVAAALVAVSPSIVTYSRHLLHDALVLDLTFGAVLSFITALHYPAADKRGRPALFGLSACLSLFLATKANFFFILVVLLAFWLTWRFPRRFAPALVVGLAVGGGIAAKTHLPVVVTPLFAKLGTIYAPIAGALLILLLFGIPAFAFTWKFLPDLPMLCLTWRIPRRLGPALGMGLLVGGAAAFSQLILAAIHLEPGTPATELVSTILIFLSFGGLAFAMTWWLLPESFIGRIWPALLFAIVSVSAVIWPRDNTFSDPDKAHQHHAFQIIGVLACGVFWYWLWSRTPDEKEIEGRVGWKGGKDWGMILLAIAWAIWIYVFLFGQGAQILAQWITTRQFPSDTWISGRDSAQHAILKMLEYWGGQQATPRLPSRHDYYIVLGILYELPIYIAAMGGIWYATKKRTVFTDFLLWWAFASWTVYAVANEKVPWLLVHLILPLALLGALWIASLDWRKPAFFTAACAGLLFALRGDVAMIFERAGDHAEPLLYAQTPDEFRDVLADALKQTRGDSRDIWMNGERQWPSVWYLRDEKWNPIRGKSGTPIAGLFDPDRYRVFIAQDTDLPKLKNKDEWNLKTVNFLIWPRVSWTGLKPNRFVPWFFTRETIPKNEEQVGPGESKTSILSGKGEWSHATAIIGSRKEGR
ncbi:hypothetical protein IAD21_05008 [Abditibacteriota bacterium]|nr:hypothetical protein IAD21_05008 [Abditibacteriota bacterium]